MAPEPKITKIELEGFTWDVKGMVIGPGGKACYDPDSTTTRQGGGIRIYADNGVVGEYAGWNRDLNGVASIAESLIGQNPLWRDRIYQEHKASLEAADQLVTIPMWGTMSSLNVAVTASLLLYEIGRRRSRSRMIACGLRSK